MKNMFEEVPKNYQSTLEHFANFQQEVMKNGQISKKNKELILIGVNAARRYEKSMLHHAKNAVDEGATVHECIEILTPCILSRGIPAWLEGFKAIQYVKEYCQSTTTDSVQDGMNIHFQEIDEALTYFKEEAGGAKADWVKVMEDAAPEVLLHYGSLRASILQDGVVSRKLKEFVLVAINVAERYEKGIELHANSARKLGATDKELAEVILLGCLASGLPAWLEGSEFI